jgi:hypothetical protein
MTWQMIDNQGVRIETNLYESTHDLLESLRYVLEGCEEEQHIEIVITKHHPLP